MTNKHMKKMFKITNYLGNANQNHNERLLHTPWLTTVKKKKKQADDDMEKLEPFFIASGHVEWHNHY